MIELKPHYSLLFIDNRDTEVILAKYTGSFKLPSNITFTRLKNHLVISINIKCHSSESDELKATLLENRFNIQSFIGYKINNDYWNIIYKYGYYKGYQFYVNSEFIVEYNMINYF
jgi:hypothetical protein